ncbi:DUF2171 domain-containing protein [Paracraurococcus lichenis]|uniref:DUF2171 domain-containing protein n=1 Tax=Paracraurococcus lichenis TaxID=3064888 RepID=A0ABT9E070_9PROT|nr:DUF2171 domain-containing protein [Paracraurococcus sp. LOR1-02]MDO9709551.1 DUF2171 domain-containing protein [Paracraurococcus sp. LOR1-02]
MKATRESIREHMEVVGADGGHVGTVDKVDGDRIKLTRTDRGAGGQHHWLPLSMAADIEGDLLRLTVPLDRVAGYWENEQGFRGPIESDDAETQGMGEALKGQDPQR